MASTHLRFDLGADRRWASAKERACFAPRRSCFRKFFRSGKGVPELLPAYELDHRRIDPDLRQSLLQASARTLDRLLAPLRAGLARRGGTKPGSLLRSNTSRRKTVSSKNNWAKSPAFNNEQRRRLVTYSSKAMVEKA